MAARRPADGRCDHRSLADDRCAAPTRCPCRHSVTASQLKVNPTSTRLAYAGVYRAEVTLRRPDDIRCEMDLRGMFAELRATVRRLASGGLVDRADLPADLDLKLALLRPVLEFADHRDLIPVMAEIARQQGGAHAGRRTRRTSGGRVAGCKAADSAHLTGRGTATTASTRVESRRKVLSSDPDIEREDAHCAPPGCATPGCRRRPNEAGPGRGHIRSRLTAGRPPRRPGRRRRSRPTPARRRSVPTRSRIGRGCIRVSGFVRRAEDGQVGLRIGAEVDRDRAPPRAGSGRRGDRQRAQGQLAGLVGVVFARCPQVDRPALQEALDLGRPEVRVGLLDQHRGGDVGRRRRGAS